jgi:hypothetical protein
MNHFIEVLIRYSKATNTPLPIKDEEMDLSAFFLEVYSKGCMSVELFEELHSILN